MKKSILILTILAGLSFLFTSAIANSSTNNDESSSTTYVIVQHDVKDYDQWKRAFDADAKRRSKSDIKEVMLLRGQENSNFITGVFEVKNIDSARRFFEDPNTAKLMGDAGVTSKPEITYVMVDNTNESTGNSVMLVTHDVKDYAQWKKAFDKHQSAREEYNIEVIAVGSNADVPTNIVALLGSDDAANFGAFFQSAEVQNSMAEAGVASEPITVMLTK